MEFAKVATNSKPPAPSCGQAVDLDLQSRLLRVGFLLAEEEDARIWFH